MAGPQSFLDNLANLRIVMSVALEHVQANRDEFIKNATGTQVRQFERAISQIRTFSEQLDQEFTSLEGMIAGARVIQLHENRR